MAIVVGTVSVLAVVMLSLRAIQPDGWMAILDRLAALTLLVGGVAHSVVSRGNAGLLAVLAGLSWVGLSWTTATVFGADPVLGPGTLLAPLLVPLLVLVALQLPRPSRRDGIGTRLAVVAIIAIAMVGVVRAVVYEPFLDLDCGPFCGHNPVLLTADNGLAEGLARFASGASVLLCASVAVVLVRQVTSLSSAGSRTRAAIVIGAAGMGGLAIAALIDFGRFASSATEQGSVAVFFIQALACCAMGDALLVLAADRVRVRRNVAEVVRLVGARDGPLGLQQLLIRAVGDPGLRVGYWLDDLGYVGPDGTPLDVETAGTQRIELTSRGRSVAIVVYDSSSVSGELIEEHLGPQARLALQNDSLELELRRRLNDLRASRRRIVEAGDAERLRLERDLHDGAQQLLLALSFELRRAERAATTAWDSRSTALLRAARSAADTALQQLRTLAHGIHPAIVAGAGLQDGLISYAATADASLTMSFNLEGRLPPSTEVTLYGIITAMTGAAPRGSPVSVSIRCHGSSAVVTVDGVAGAPEHVLDRIEAAGGTVTSMEQGLELVVPCA